MKRKLALMLTMTLLAGSLDSGMLVSAADFSAEESVEQAVEEELQPTEENGAEELTDAEEELPSDETNVSEAELVDDPGEDGSEMTESGVDEADISTEPRNRTGIGRGSGARRGHRAGRGHGKAGRRF